MSNDLGSLRTPMSRVRHLGSARSGTQHLMRMRATSLALVPLTIAFVWLILSLVGKDYNTVRATLGAPLPAISVRVYQVSESVGRGTGRSATL